MIPSAQNIDTEEYLKYWASMRRHGNVLIYCRSGRRALEMAYKLKQ